MAVNYCGICFITLATGVNFTNILWAAFGPKSFRRKITNPNCKHIRAAQKTFVKKAARKILVKQVTVRLSFPGRRSTPAVICLPTATSRRSGSASACSSSPWSCWCQSYKTFFPSSLTKRPNKLEDLSLETLSNKVLEFEGKARANPIGAPFRCFLLG